MSLQMHNDSTFFAAAGGAYRRADAATVFGSESVVCIPARTETARPMPAGDPLFQLSVVAVLVAAAITLRSGGRVTGLLAGIFGNGISGERDSGRRTALLPDGFLLTAAAAGLITSAVMAAAYFDLLAPRRIAEAVELPPVAVAGLALAAAACVAAYQYAALKLIGAVAHKRDFTEALLYVKKAMFAAVALCVAPVFVLSALASEAGREVWLWVLGAECCILSLLFLKETVLLFVRKKVPFLHWFLYLCTVEAFPLSLICASIGRIS